MHLHLMVSSAALLVGSAGRLCLLTVFFVKAHLRISSVSGGVLCHVVVRSAGRLLLVHGLDR